MKTYGYCRVSTKAQSIERQVRNIKAVYPDAIIMQEAYTGRKVEGRKELCKLLQAVHEGDTIIFDSVSRMSRNAVEGYELYMKLYNAGINLHFLKEPQIDTDTYKTAAEQQIALHMNTGKEMYDGLLKGILDAVNGFIAALAKEQIRMAFEASQREVDDLSQRTREGIETARLEGKQIGQAAGRKLTVKKAAPAKARIRELSRDFDGSLSDLDAMKVIGIARNTYYKYKRELLDELQNGK